MLPAVSDSAVATVRPRSVTTAFNCLRKLTEVLIGRQCGSRFVTHRKSLRVSMLCATWACTGITEANVQRRNLRPRSETERPRQRIHT